MNKIKKAGIVAGAIFGGVLGGTISVIGKVSKQKFIDDLGESVVDSTILTGSIAGEVASGATSFVSGKIKKKPEHVKRGKKDLQSAGGKVVDNFMENVHTLADNSGEILDGMKKKDKRQVKKAVGNLVKVMIIGAITVGAVKTRQESQEPPQECPADEDFSAEE